MKLNLVPTSVKKGGSLKTAWIGAILLTLASAVGFFLMLTTATKQLDDAKAQVETYRADAAAAVATAKTAQAIVDSTKPLATNLELAKTMGEHNSKYTRFYNQVRQYIPGFLRLTDMSVTPNDENSCTLNLGGVLYSAHDYAHATIALLRIPGARSVSRNGYAPRPVFVPGLTEEDQQGRSFRVGSEPLPTDPAERLAAIIARAEGQTVGFANLNNYGAVDPTPRGPMQTGSAVTFSVLMTGEGLPEGWDINFMVPNPTSTLATINSAAGTTTGGGGTPPPAPGPIPGI